jgi:hypothetical protein
MSFFMFSFLFSPTFKPLAEVAKLQLLIRAGLQLKDQLVFTPDAAIVAK